MEEEYDEDEVVEDEDCQHQNVLVVYRYWAGSFYEPPESEILYCECKDCEEVIDWERAHKNAKVEEIDYRDWY